MEFSTILKDLDGNEIDEVVPGKDGKPTTRKMTLANVCSTALLANHPDEQTLSGDEKVKRFILATKIHGAGDLDLAAEDIVLTKRLVAKTFGPLVCGQAWGLLDPASK